MQREIDELRSLLPTDVPFGVNVFSPSGGASNPAVVSAYARRLSVEADRRGISLGSARWDDDNYAGKVDQLCHQSISVVSFTFGCPDPAVVESLHAVGTSVWVSVTTVEEARSAQRVGADALVVQGVEVGGHRHSFDDTQPGDIGLLALLQLVDAAIADARPLIASGGLSTGRGVAAALGGWCEAGSVRAALAGMGRCGRLGGRGRGRCVGGARAVSGPVRGVTWLLGGRWDIGPGRSGGHSDPSGAG